DDDGVAAPRLRRLVLLLDEEPVVGAVAPPAPYAHEVPAPGELLAMQPELEVPFLVGALGIEVLVLAVERERLPGAAVPEEDGAAAVLALRDDPLEVAVVDGVVLDVDGEALLAGVEARPLGHRPALQDPVELEAEVVVEAAGVVLLDDEGEALPFR